MWCVIVEFVAADSVHKFCRVREGTKRQVDVSSSTVERERDQKVHEVDREKRGLWQQTGIHFSTCTK